MSGIENQEEWPDKDEHKMDLRKRCPEIDEDFIPLNLRNDEKEPKQKRRRRPRQCYKIWDSEENKIFLEFLTLNRSSFKDLMSRRSNKVFVNMSKNFQFRNSHQCKSHYQKLQKLAKNKTINEVIKYLQKKLKKQKILFQRVIKGHEVVYPQQKDMQTGWLNIFHMQEKFFEIHVHLNAENINEW